MSTFQQYIASRRAYVGTSTDPLVRALHGGADLTGCDNFDELKSRLTLAGVEMDDLEAARELWNRYRASQGAPFVRKAKKG